MSFVMRDISPPVVRRAKKPADWARMRPNNWLRRSRTMRSPTPVIR